MRIGLNTYDINEEECTKKIVPESVYSLRHVLKQMSKKVLYQLAKVQDIEGRSKMNKAKLIDALYEVLLNQENFDMLLINATPFEREVLDLLQKEQYVLLQEKYLYSCEHFFTTGYIYLLIENNQYILTMPYEIKQMYQNTKKPEFEQQYKEYILLAKYLTAAANLYGAISTKKFLEIYNSQNVSQLTFKEFYNKSMILQIKPQLFYVFPDIIVSEYFLHEEDELLELFTETANKPYYIPPKEKFLKYVDSFYIEMTPQLKALKSFILSSICKDKELVDVLIEDLWLQFSIDAELETILDEFERRDIDIKEKHFIKLVTLLTEAHNNTRQWYNRGHTPAELFKLYSSQIVPLSKSNSSYPQNRPRKIGRNDPCICGSGKKYKHCCGK